MLLNCKPLGSRIPSLDTFSTAILKASAVELVSLAATLFQKATYGGTTWVIRIPTAVGHLHAPELDYSGDIRIYRTLRVEVTFLSIASSRCRCRCYGWWRYIALTVVGKDSSRLGNWHCQRYGESFSLTESSLLIGLEWWLRTVIAAALLRHLDAPQEDIFLQPSS